ncbi:MAG TPA: hypothetical protein VFX21_13970 [Acidimicrobiia bacterium]|nr:hypothetical protein [Acidimicrobiia bacterium]
MDIGGDEPGLAPAYQLALDLEAEGFEGPALAERLGVPEAALSSLLRVAHAKAGTEARRTDERDDG